MTVSSSTNRVTYAGNGSTTVFPYTYKIFDQDDLTVILRAANGTETVQTITSQYTVSGVGNAGGGNVTMLTAPASGTTLVILREQDLVQELDIVPNDPFPADSLEGALDKLTFMVQQHEETLGRSLKVSRTTTITSPEFTEDPATRANKFLSFDASGDLFVADTTDGGVAVSTYMETFLQSSDSPTAFTYLGVTSSAAELNTLDGITATTAQLNNSQFLPSSGPLSNRNLIINGAMQVAQRGTSVAGASSGNSYHTNDRFYFGVGLLGTWTVTQEADGPSGFSNSMKVECTTASASPASSGFVYIGHRLEGQNLQQIAKGTADAKPLVLSFWVKSNVTGTYQVSFVDNDNTRMVAGTYSISSSGTWEYKTIDVAADTTGVLGNDNGAGFQIEWWLGSGTDYTTGTAPTAWEARDNTDRNAGSNVNVGDTIGNYFQLTGVQLEAGDTATPFEHRSYGEELALCERYTRKMGDGLFGNAISAIDVALFAQFVPEMRSAPSAILIDTSIKVTDSYFADHTSSGSSISSYVASKAGVRFFVNNFSGMTTGRLYGCFDNTDGTFILFSAEL